MLTSEQQYPYVFHVEVNLCCLSDWELITGVLHLLPQK